MEGEVPVRDWELAVEHEHRQRAEERQTCVLSCRFRSASSRVLAAEEGLGSVMQELAVIVPDGQICQHLSKAAAQRNAAE